MITWNRSYDDIDQKWTGTCRVEWRKSRWRQQHWMDVYFYLKKIIQPHQCDNQFLSSFNPQRRVLVKKWVFMQKILKLVNSAEEFWIACCLDHFECVFYGVGQFNFCRNDFKNIQKKHINLSLAAHFLQMKHHTANLRNGLLEHVQLFNGTQCTYYPFSIFSHWKIVG